MNSRKLSLAAFGLGLAVVIWVAVGYAVSAHVLALTMTLAIGAVYVYGAIELRRFHDDTAELSGALRTLPAGRVTIESWLAALPAALRNAVRLRIEGERVALPGPAVTPYLVGLLVMLGMLGTFLGMVVTLNGAVMALEGSTDLSAIRAALSAPVKGLGLAFGTSVAGVAASAMLGLVSALCRRERQEAGLLLDTHIAGTLREFSLTHQRQETFKAMQQQAQVLPAVAEQLAALMTTLERQNLATQQSLTAGQESFHREARAAYTELAASVERSLRTALTDTAASAVATVKPAVETALDGFARAANAQHAHIAATVERQLDGIAARFDAGMAQTTARWAEALDSRLDTQGAQEAERLAGWTQSLDAIGTGMQAAWQDMAERAQARDEAAHAALIASTRELTGQMQQTVQTQMHATLTALDTQAQATLAATGTQARTMIDAIARLVDSAAAAPQAAAELIERLRTEVTANLARDNALLEERSRMGADLQALLDRLKSSATAQEAAVATLVSASSARLEDAAATLANRVDAESMRLLEGTAQIAAGAAEVASLGEAFGHAVELFSRSGESMTAHLQRLEAALEQAMARSDDQLAYYVAQAREIIDLSVMSQQRVVEDLRQIAGRTVPSGVC